jgi:hypothetical protein
MSRILLGCTERVANLATDTGSPDLLMREECMELAVREEERIH